LHKPSGQLPRWGAKNVLPLNLIAFPSGDREIHGKEVPHGKAGVEGSIS